MLYNIAIFLSYATSVIDMPKPTNKREMLRVFRMVTYVAKFIQNLSDISTPLHKLTKDDVPSSWNATHSVRASEN